MRCAIYTRKSSTEGLDQQYNSLENQRQYCSAYIASQGGAGWLELPAIYDDGGFSGGNLNRPALKRLLDDVKGGLIDIVVVYKIDRLSRSLRDFTNLVANLDERGVTFVSVTQAFDTGTSMGRLTLNVLLSFAQFERELTSERLKDKFAASRARGLWLHGRRPYGYRVVDLRLETDEAEANVIRKAFRRYPNLLSYSKLATELNKAGHRGRHGGEFTVIMVQKMLQSRLYRGEMKNQEGVTTHEPIITESAWRRVQQAISSANRRAAPRRRVAHMDIMLKGILVTVNDIPMEHRYLHYALRSGERRVVRLYQDGRYRRRKMSPPPIWPTVSYRAEELEADVISALDRLICGAPSSPRSHEDCVAMVRGLVDRIAIDGDRMTITLKSGLKFDAYAGGRTVIRRKT
ncbi:recombinase family protein [Rhizobium cremeum]|uniref:recombinase family protein n=1 Tax=Rhizobium cremeum TaxID=2813827 RepID=UPI0039DF91E6